MYISEFCIIFVSEFKYRDMKNLLIILFLLCTINVASQDYKRMVYTKPNGDVLVTNTLIKDLDFLISYTDTLSMFNNYIEESDTIKIIMLLSDTTVVENGRGSTISYQDTNLVWWDYGYKINTYSSFVWDVHFLDSEKRKLNKDIVVWTYGEVNNE